MEKRSEQQHNRQDILKETNAATGISALDSTLQVRRAKRPRIQRPVYSVKPV